jgi:hypothetical protein
MYSSAAKLNMVNGKFKEILNLAYNDVEYSVNFNSSLSDLAVCVAAIFRSDFANNVLPAAFYSSLQSSAGGGGVGGGNTSSHHHHHHHHHHTSTSAMQSSTSSVSSQFSRLADIDLISGALLNSHYMQLINEAISHRPVFSLFRELATTSNQSNEREVLCHLLNEIYLKQNRIGYYFLYYMYSVMIKVRLANYTNSTSPSYKTNNNELLSIVRIYKEFMQERAKSAAASAANLISNNNNGSKHEEYEKASSSSSSASSVVSISSNDEQDYLSDEEDVEGAQKRLNEADVNLGKYVDFNFQFASSSRNSIASDSVGFVFHYINQLFILL